MGEVGIKTQILKYYEDEEEKEYSMYYSPEYVPFKRCNQLTDDENNELNDIKENIDITFDIW